MSARMHFRIGTRGSRLALRQAEETALLLLRGIPDATTQIVPIRTKGDVRTDVPFGAIGETGLFTKEIEKALLAGEIDLAVHSLKDLPYALPEGLQLAAFLKREEPNDVLIAKNNLTIDTLPEGAKVGTSSIRRRAQLKRLRPDLTLVHLRGNVQTRIEKMEREGLDATVLAYAGILRLHLSKLVSQVIPVEQMLPAPGQGIIVVEARADAPFFSLLRDACNDADAETEALAERAFLSVLEGGCQIPMAANARRKNDSLVMRGSVFSEDGTICYSAHMEAKASEAEETGRSIAASLLEQGARSLLTDASCGRQEG